MKMLLKTILFGSLFLALQAALAVPTVTIDKSKLHQCITNNTVIKKAIDECSNEAFAAASVAKTGQFRQQYKDIFNGCVLVDIAATTNHCTATYVVFKKAK